MLTTIKRLKHQLRTLEDNFSIDGFKVIKINKIRESHRSLPNNCKNRAIISDCTILFGHAEDAPSIRKRKTNSYRHNHQSTTSYLDVALHFSSLSLSFSNTNEDIIATYKDKGAMKECKGKVVYLTYDMIRIALNETVLANLTGYDLLLCLINNIFNNTQKDFIRLQQDYNNKKRMADLIFKSKTAPFLHQVSLDKIENDSLKESISVFNLDLRTECNSTQEYQDVQNIEAKLESARLALISKRNKIYNNKINDPQNNLIKNALSSKSATTVRNLLTKLEDNESIMINNLDTFFNLLSTIDKKQLILNTEDITSSINLIIKNSSDCNRYEPSKYIINYHIDKFKQLIE